ncbi:MAG: glycosyltransferase family 2 protein [Paramuribaculum sp.]|nr:glycosyltransferase family 2 protein [Paramuribaculum sp.]
MGKITATILTFNEEKRIRACLDSLRDIADEIIVVDSFSTDRTLDICRSYGCRVTQRRLAGYGAQRQYATSLASYSYVLAIDADEVLSPALRQSLISLKSRPFEHRVYAFSRLNFFCGQPVKRCGWYPDLQIRLFDRRYANWNLRDVSEKVIFRDTVRPFIVDGDILHYRCSTPEEFNTTELHHASIRARVLATRCSSIGPLRPLYEGIKDYVRCMVMQGAWLDGTAGRTIAKSRFRSTLLAHRVARRLIISSRTQSDSPSLPLNEDNSAD